jgi:VIT1/CCC1 family predicted Fe2+/Mn2+ transporter
MPRDRRRGAKYAAGVLALAAMLAIAPFFFASGLMAPGWAVGVFIAAWLVLFGLGCFWIRRKPLRVVALPFIAAAIWLGGMSAGEAWLGWTA